MENDQLSRYLAALEREGCYRVDVVLKKSPHEITQRVFFVDANGAESGPYVRKFIDRDSGMGAAYERIFEAQESGRRFKHIPQLFECYHDERYLVVVMEFVHGETLQDAVYHRDPSLQLAREVFPSLCDAVSELHESFDPPLIHRDLKPSNVMLTDDSLFIIDFGIARAYRQGADADTVKFGTRAFAPPEQFGFGQTTEQSDVYALGMMLYFCLTEAISTSQVRDAGFETEGVPPFLRSVLVRATAIDASSRYKSAAELKDAFIEAVAQEGTPSRETLPGRSATTREQAERSDSTTWRASSSESDMRDEPARRKSKAPAVIVAAIVFAFALCGAFVFASGAFNQLESSGGQASSSAGSSAAAVESAPESTASSQAETGGGANERAENDGQATANEEAARAAASDIQTSAPPRNDFNPATNTTTTIAGVTFQIPRCFGQAIANGEGPTYYYAERGTACAMIMTMESALDDPPTDFDTAAERKDMMDSYQAGLTGSNEELFADVTQVVDCSLAGYPARVVAIHGTMDGLPTTSKVAYFYNPDANAIAAIFYGQTDNAQFDYSEDFAKTIASATNG